MINFRMLKASDGIIWIAVAFLIAVSFISIFSVTFKSDAKNGFDFLSYIQRQAGSLVIGLCGLAVFSYLDYRNLKNFAIPLYIIMLFLLVFVIFGGTQASGASRWISLGFLSFQPSEITKLIVIITLAAYFDNLRNGARSFVVLLLAGIPAFLIFKQPDLGTALVVIAIALGMLIWNKTSYMTITMVLTPIFSLLLRPNFIVWLVYLLILWGILYFSRVSLIDLLLILAINIGVGIAFPIIWGMLKEYQKVRIISFLNPNVDPFGAGYHTLQSIIAVGAGGIFGRGFLSGTQTQLHFIPEQHSDFIYSAVAEEFGFIGAVLVLLALFAIARRAFIIADESRDYFGSILAAGGAVMISFHTLVSVGMVLGVMPVVGIPLPFVSFGGTALIIDLILIGIIQSVAMRRQKLIF